MYWFTYTWNCLEMSLCFWVGDAYNPTLFDSKFIDSVIQDKLMGNKTWPCAVSNGKEKLVLVIIFLGKFYGRSY